MRLPWLLAAGAALGAADDGAPRAATRGAERNPPAWPAAVRVVAPAQCAEIGAADAGAALLLLPGAYDCSIALPARSTAAGLGIERDAVRLKRCVGDAASSAENLRIDGDWRGPLSVRRVHVDGDLASSSFMADSNITGGVRLGAARAFAARSSQLQSSRSVEVDAKGWFASSKRDPAPISGGSITVVLAGVAGGPNATVPRGAAPGVAYVTTDAPRALDKPYIVRDGPDFFLIKPKPRLATTGCCATEMERIPFQNVYVARPERPEDVREKLLRGLHVVLTPGIYELEDGLELNHAGQVLLGVGEVIVRAPSDGEPACRVRGPAAVVAGITVEGARYPKGDTALIRWEGADGLLADVSVNVAGDANARTGVAVHADNVVLDHVTVSREPPGHLDVGISVEGARVHAYAISIKHVEQDGVRWRGEDGHALGINVDLPRDAAADFQNGGYVGFAIGDFVKRHGARGVAVYASFESDVRVRTAVRRSASPNVTLASVASVYTEGRGAIASVVNGDGAAVGPAGNAVARWP